jgi:DNA repair protein RecO (recombination protein O)
LDLLTCAATGVKTNLTYVSPKTGRAVSQEAGLKYHSKLLPLPSFLLNGHTNKLNVSTSDIIDGLSLTGYFLKQHVFNQLNRKAPGARERLIYFLNNKFSTNLPCDK